MNQEHPVTVIFQVRAEDISKVKGSVKHLALGDIQTLAPFVSQEIKNTPAAIDPNLKLAKEIAEAIRPRGKQTMREDALRAALNGYDSLTDSLVSLTGHTDHEMRVALAALSKALRPFAKFNASPMDLIAVRERKYFDDGTYRATVYSCTPLGKLVKKELERLKVL